MSRIGDYEEKALKPGDIFGSNGKRYAIKELHRESITFYMLSGDRPTPLRDANTVNITWQAFAEGLALSEWCTAKPKAR